MISVADFFVMVVVEEVEVLLATEAFLGFPPDWIVVETSLESDDVDGGMLGGFEEFVAELLVCC